MNIWVKLSRVSSYGSLVFLFVLIAACAPRLDALVPAIGPERTLVRVEGQTVFATTYWDSGSPTATALPGGFLAASLFSVPDAATLGGHNVQLRSGSRVSDTEVFTVTAPQPFPKPRLDRISLVFTKFDVTTVDAWLFVQAANADVGAEILVDGNVVPSIAHKGLFHDLLGINPSDLQYPIYHHIAFIVPINGEPRGSTIVVQVRNQDGSLSDTRSYTLPVSPITLDSDGDDIPDVWELNGYDGDGDGVIDVDLPALGADPFRPDIFVEVDIMNGLANPPTAAVWVASRDVFANAPIINPFGDNGINLALDTTGSIAFSQTVGFSGTTNTTTSHTNFYDIKNNLANFDNTRRGRIYHYALWVNMYPAGWSGIAEIQGDDLIVSFDDFPGPYQTVRSMAETFVHELGHNLNLRHGGGSDNSTRKPNYSSVMSYSWQLRTGRSNAARNSTPIYAPLYYDQTGIVEIGGALPATPGISTDYSDGMGRVLDESALNELIGLYNGNSIDWNGDGDALDNPVAADADRDGILAEILIDAANWANLRYSGPRINTD